MPLNHNPNFKINYPNFEILKKVFQKSQPLNIFIKKRKIILALRVWYRFGLNLILLGVSDTQNTVNCLLTGIQGLEEKCQVFIHI